MTKPNQSTPPHPPTARDAGARPGGGTSRAIRSTCAAFLRSALPGVLALATQGLAVLAAPVGVGAGATLALLAPTAALAQASSSSGLIQGTTLASRRPRERLPENVAPSAETVAEARAALGRGDAEQALSRIERGVSNWPDDVQLLFLRGLALQRLDRLDQAEDAFLRLSQQYPEMPESYNNLAVIRAARGNLDGARIALEDAVRALPDYALAQANLGDIYARMAARSYRAALGIDPSSESTRARLKLVTQATTPMAAPITKKR